MTIIFSNLCQARQVNNVATPVQKAMAVITSKSESNHYWLWKTKVSSYDKALWGLKTIFEYKRKFSALPDYEGCLLNDIIEDSGLKSGDVMREESYAFWDAVLALEDVKFVKWLVNRGIETYWNDDLQAAQYMGKSPKSELTAHSLVQKKFIRGEITEIMRDALIEALGPESTD